LDWAEAKKQVITPRLLHRDDHPVKIALQLIESGWMEPFPRDESATPAGTGDRGKSIF
jgi:hypothetical protein